MPINTTTTLPAPIQHQFNMTLLSVAVPNLIYSTPAQKKRMEKNNGLTQRFQKYTKLATATTPLGNTGITPPGQLLHAVNVDATIEFYGTYTTTNEQVVISNQGKVLNEGVKLLGICMRETEDELTRNQLLGSAGFINATGGTNGDNPTNIGVSDLASIIEILVGNNAKTMLDEMPSNQNTGVSPVRDAYYALGHTKLIRSLERLDGFHAKITYPSPMNALRSEWGSYRNLRFLLSSNAAVIPAASTDGQDVYATFCCGQEAYAIIDLDGHSAEFIYTPRIFSGPLAQNCSMAFKMAQVSKILDSSWITSVRSTSAI